MGSTQAVIAGKCPKCETGKIFATRGNIFLLRMPQMNERCPSCKYKFDRESGYFLGAMYVSYGMTVLEMILVFLSTFWFIPLWTFYTIILSVLVLTSFFNYRMSRIIWIHLFSK